MGTSFIISFLCPLNNPYSIYITSIFSNVSLQHKKSPAKQIFLINRRFFFKSRKRHLARINGIQDLPCHQHGGWCFNAASGTWRASTVPCLKPHDTWPDRAILTWHSKFRRFSHFRTCTQIYKMSHCTSQSLTLQGLSMSTPCPAWDGQKRPFSPLSISIHMSNYTTKHHASQ